MLLSADYFGSFEGDVAEGEVEEEEQSEIICSADNRMPLCGKEKELLKTNVK